MILYVTIISLAWHSHEKNLFVAKLEIFQGHRERGERKIMKGCFVREESRGVSHKLVAFRGRYCACLLAGSHTIFHRILFPRDTLNFFPSRFTTFDTVAKMIHWNLWKWRTILIKLNPPWGIRNNHDTIFRHYCKQFSTFYTQKIPCIHFFS